ncbi:hypothetical protein T4E_12311 [Trichinella pseudospiralis]|uniref:Uncharacterized protein n=1 Tax=Trichinella pseudospiralis TaxID=6337 RepID=A0A0V0YDB1_TRIPS|nr:hypothetical protein T4E_12311 [Trichinella pseudospiralis]
MAYVSELYLVTNCCGSISNAYEGRAYKLKCTGQEELQRFNNLMDVTAGSRQTEPLHGSMPGGSATGMQNGKMAVLEKRSAEEAKYIPQFYDKEAASAEPSQHLDIF